jgi:MPBQ/MSBQ methyltransferase
MDALRMDFADDSFDYVWACESGEHMPDKLKYVEEMTRVLKPGGRVVIATWCQREEGSKPFSKSVRTH